MDTPISRPRRQSLANSIASELRQFIIKSGFSPGQRLPTTSELASRFQVGMPTMREALRKLETMGVVTLKHGSGIFVGDRADSLFLPNPVPFLAGPTKQLLLDLIDARKPIESLAAALAAKNITDVQLATLQGYLDTAKANLHDDDILNHVNMSFHRGVAEASGNSVLPEILGVLTELFANEQRLILNIYGSRQKDHSEHLAIFDALQRRDVTLTTKRMEAHLEGVRHAILQWVPESDLAEQT
jgi:GntR family transcriptional repressor for pyruvate dehydrogenase complex